MCKYAPGERLHTMRTLVILGAATLLACRADTPPATDMTPILRAARFTVPAGAGIPARPCGDSLAYFAGTAITHCEAWYGKHLTALQEPVLCQSSLEEAKEIYRLTWLPSFHPSVVVRIDSDTAGLHLTAKVESGAGGYEPGHLARDTVFMLTETQAREFADLLSAADFWRSPTVPPPDRAMGLDGAQWVLEGIANSRYHVVDRWSPEAGGPDARFRALCEWLLARSGFVTAAIY